MRRTLKELAQAVGARLLGDGAQDVGSIASVESAREDDLVFVESEERLKAALESRAAAVIAGDFAAGTQSHKPILIAAQPRLAFARAAALLHPPRRPEPGIHSSAVVDESADVGSHVAVEAHAVVGENAVLGDYTRIGPGAVVKAGVRIGSGCDIGANVVIYSGTTLGDRVIVLAGAVLGSDGFGYVRDPATGRYEKFPQVGRLEIGDDVEIGANSTIARGALDATVIGRGTKIDNLVHVAHNVRIGEDVAIAAQSGISGSTRIDSGVMMGGQVGIADHVHLGEGVILGAQSGVGPGKILQGKGEIFFGSPARPLRQTLRELAALAHLAKKDKREKE